MSLSSRTPPTVEEIRAYPQRFSNWGRWGADDQLGTINHITPAVRAAAAATIRHGRTVSLARPLAVRPGPRNPLPVQHFMMVNAQGSSDYIGMQFHGLANTHIDALSHIFSDGKMYNGRPASDVTSAGARSGNVEVLRDGIVTRGVLYDIPRLRGTPHVAPDSPVQGWELQQAAQAQGVEPQPGDAVLVRSALEPFYAANPQAGLDGSPIPGVHVSAAEFLYETDAALLGWDALDARMPELPVNLHWLVVPYMGMPLLDNADLERLAATCAELGRWEFCFMLAPLIVPRGTGSPVNPLAIF